jgi:hypothetical protein
MPLQKVGRDHSIVPASGCVLAELVTRGLITDEVPAQILSQEHSGFGAWVGDPFTEEDRTRFVARYIERGPLSLEKLSITDDFA